MTRICTICARGGSKGVVNKNIRPLAGKPLIAYSLEQAQASGLFRLVAVSSDSAEILAVACAHGADILVMRPAELASDTAGKVPAIQHCVNAAEAEAGIQCDVVVDLDVTSPLRAVSDIHGAVQLLETKNASNVITGTPARRSPYFNLVEVGENDAVSLSKPLPTPILRRQDSPRCFDMNASIYVWRRSALFSQSSLFNADTRLFVMPEERSTDIDSERDFEFVELLMKKRPRDE